MSVDLRDLSKFEIRQLTWVLFRRPELGIARPSGRWLKGQQTKLSHLPSELLRPSNILQRAFMKIVDRINLDALDPMAVLCEVHHNLNPFLIRRLFLAIVYEATVHTDLLRSWKGKSDVPVLAAFSGRLDDIAALWTEPELFRQCYGTSPFQNHMVFVESRCEACILSAIGASARLLADLQANMANRVERHPSRKPRLAPFVEAWIGHFDDAKLARCRSMRDEVLDEFRANRPELSEWRHQRRKEQRRRPLVYMELKNTRSGAQLSRVPDESRRSRRSKNGIPVAMADPEDAEEQRRAAARHIVAPSQVSVYRSDGLVNHSQLNIERAPAYVPTNEPLYEEDDLYNNDDEVEETNAEQDLERDRNQVTSWYATQLQSRTNLNEDDTKSMLSAIHPALMPSGFSNLSAVPQPLSVKKDGQPAPEMPKTESVWTDATVYTVDPSASTVHGIPNQGDVPPVPRIPSMHGHESARRSRRHSDHSERTPRARLQRRMTSIVEASPSNTPIPQPPATASSVYSTGEGFPSPTSASTRAPSPILYPPPLVPPARSEKPNRKFIFTETPEGSVLTTHQKRYLKNRKKMHSFAREENPFTSETEPRQNTPGPSTRRSGSVKSSASGRSKTITPAPSASSSRGSTARQTTASFDKSTLSGASTPLTTPDHDSQSDEAEASRDSTLDSQSMIMWRRGFEKDNITPWHLFMKNEEAE